MKDQAEKLREMINLKETAPKKKINSKNKNKLKTIAITSGKGGVGKTNFTVNIAIALGKLGKRVTIIDADLGLANIDVILGTMPKYTLTDLVTKNIPLKKVMSEGPEGIRLISGASGVEGLIDTNDDSFEKLIDKISEINNFSDILLIDTGAGISKSVLSFVFAADSVVVVSTPEPTSITDAYAVIKTIGNQDKTKDIDLIINRARTSKEAEEVYLKLKKVCKNFIGMDLKKLGYINDDTVVRDAVYKQIPFLIEYPKSKASRQIESIAKIIAGHEDINTTSESFFNKVAGFFNKR